MINWGEQSWLNQWSKLSWLLPFLASLTSGYRVDTAWSTSFGVPCLWTGLNNVSRVLCGNCTVPKTSSILPSLSWTLFHEWMHVPADFPSPHFTRFCDKVAVRPPRAWLRAQALQIATSGKQWQTTCVETGFRVALRRNIKSFVLRMSHVWYWYVMWVSHKAWLPITVSQGWTLCGFLPLILNCWGQFKLERFITKSSKSSD